MKKYYFKCEGDKMFHHINDSNFTGQCFELCINKNKKHKNISAGFPDFAIERNDIYIGSWYCENCDNFIKIGKDPDFYVECKDIKNSVLKLQRKYKLNKLNKSKIF